MRAIVTTADSDSKSLAAGSRTPNANRVPGCQVYPVSVRCTSAGLCQHFDDVRIRSDSKTYAVHNARDRNWVSTGRKTSARIPVNAATSCPSRKCRLLATTRMDCAINQREDDMPTWGKATSEIVSFMSDQSALKQAHTLGSSLLEVVASVLHG